MCEFLTTKRVFTAPHSFSLSLLDTMVSSHPINTLSALELYICPIISDRITCKFEPYYDSPVHLYLKLAFWKFNKHPSPGDKVAELC